MKRPDGSLWRLGAGGFGTVFKALLHGVQPVAVKASALSRSPPCLGMQGGGSSSWCQQLLGDPVRPTSSNTDTGQCMSCITCKAPWQ